MDSSSRLNVFLLASLVVFVVLAFMPGEARAIGDVPKTSSLQWSCKASGVFGSETYRAGSPEAACNAANGGTRPAGSGVTLTRTFRSCGAFDPSANSASVVCWFDEKYSNYGAVYGFSVDANATRVTQCPDNSAEVGTAPNTSCACFGGFAPKNGKCEQYTCPPSGSYSAVTQPDQKVANAGDGQCSGGCSYTPSSWKVGADGQIWATWPFKSTGKFCGGDPKPGTTNVDSGEKNTKNPAPIPCGTNQCPGTVNGQAVCVPCKGQQEQGPSTSASAPSGSASGAQAGSSESSTMCNGVNCTTTTTTKDSSGTVTGTVEKTEKQESFCKENPTSALCKQSSFGGQCGAVTCEGDAIQCAIAADQYRRNCQWFDDEAAVPLSQSGNAGMNGLNQPDGHPAKSPDAVPVSFSSAIDQSDALGGGNCPSDVSFSITVPVVGAQSVNLALSKVCEPLRLVGNLGVAITLLWAGLFVFRGVS